MKISAVVLTKNEENNIARCLASLQFCNEVLVIDDYSIDKTRELARENGARVVKRRLNTDWAKQRNFGLQNAKYNWVLFIDADEVITSDLQREIATKVGRSDCDGFTFARSDHFLGKVLRHGDSAGVRLVRLGKKNAGKWRRKVHEYWDIKKTQELNNPILHYPHITLFKFINSINTMAYIHSGEIKSEGKSISMAKVIVWPFFKFVDNYVFKLGLLDGVLGFVFALMMSFHSFLAWSTYYLNTKKA